MEQWNSNFNLYNNGTQSLTITEEPNMEHKTQT